MIDGHEVRPAFAHLNALVAELRTTVAAQAEEIARLRAQIGNESVPCFFQPAKDPTPTESRREVMERLA